MPQRVLLDFVDCGGVELELEDLVCPLGRGGSGVSDVVGGVLVGCLIVGVGLAGQGRLGGISGGGVAVDGGLGVGVGVGADRRME
jgi:hypothetical protein